MCVLQQTYYVNNDDFVYNNTAKNVSMVPYKKMDLIVEAFSQMPDKKLVVIGDGPEMEKIKGKAKNRIRIRKHLKASTYLLTHFPLILWVVFNIFRSEGICLLGKVNNVYAGRCLRL